MDAREETTDTPGRQQGNKGPREQTATLYLRKERTTANDTRKWSLGQQSHLGSGGTLKKTYVRFLD
jgi:hypothetical protein